MGFGHHACKCVLQQAARHTVLRGRFHPAGRSNLQTTRLQRTGHLGCDGEAQAGFDAQRCKPLSLLVQPADRNDVAGSSHQHQLSPQHRDSTRLELPRQLPVTVRCCRSAAERLPGQHGGSWDDRRRPAVPGALEEYRVRLSVWSRHHAEWPAGRLRKARCRQLPRAGKHLVHYRFARVQGRDVFNVGHSGVRGPSKLSGTTGAA